MGISVFFSQTEALLASRVQVIVHVYYVDVTDSLKPERGVADATDSTEELTERCVYNTVDCFLNVHRFCMSYLLD